MDPYIYKVESVNRVVDGDTVDMTVDLGFSIKLKHRFRLIDYDAPETWRPTCEAEEVAGKKVTAYLQEELDKFKGNLYVRSCKLGIYGRYEGQIIAYIGGVSHIINAVMNDYIIENHLTKMEVAIKK